MGHHTYLMLTYWEQGTQSKNGKFGTGLKLIAHLPLFMRLRLVLTKGSLEAILYSFVSLYSLFESDRLFETIDLASINNATHII